VPGPLPWLGKHVSEHRVSALGLFLGSLVLDDIPVLDQNSVLHPDNIRRNPVYRQPETRETSVDDDEVSLRYNVCLSPVCDRYPDFERMAEASLEARPQRERYSFSLRVKNFGGEDRIIRVSERRGAVVTFGALLVQRRVQPYAFH
jgi:hypothetical protein